MIIVRFLWALSLLAGVQLFLTDDFGNDWLWLGATCLFSFVLGAIIRGVIIDHRAGTNESLIAVIAVLIWYSPAILTGAAVIVIYVLTEVL